MNRFSLVRLPTLEQARSRVTEDPSTRSYRAGGIDLFDRMKEGIDAPDQLVELQAIAGDEGRRMRGIVQTDAGDWRIGSLVTLGQLAEFADLPDAYAALIQAASSAATPGIRNAATVGGNLLQRPRCWYFRHQDMICLKKGGSQCLAVAGDNRYNAILGGGPSYIVHPSSVAPALVALDAQIDVWRKGETVTIPVADLFALPTDRLEREDTLHDGDIVLSVTLPAPAAGQRSAYVAAREKLSHDWPLVEAAVSCSVASGKLAGVRVALGQVAPIPWRSTEAERALEGKAADTDVFAKAAASAVAPAKPLSGNAYKIPLTQGVVRQALHAAAAVPLPE